MQMGLIFHDKKKKGMQINALICKKSNRTIKRTGALIRAFVTLLWNEFLSLGPEYNLKIDKVIVMPTNCTHFAFE